MIAGGEAAAGGDGGGGGDGSPIGENDWGELMMAAAVVAIIVSPTHNTN
jgi:hypothetical protein